MKENGMKPVWQPQVRCNDEKSLVNQKTTETYQASKGAGGGHPKIMPVKRVRVVRRTNFTYFISLPAPEDK